MRLFNMLRPELTLFRGEVVSYQFIDEGGDLRVTATPVNEFLEDVADRLFFLERLERRYETLRGIVVLFAGASMYVLAGRLAGGAWGEGMAVALGHCPRD